VEEKENLFEPWDGNAYKPEDWNPSDPNSTGPVLHPGMCLFEMCVALMKAQKEQKNV